MPSDRLDEGVRRMCTALRTLLKEREKGAAVGGATSIEGRP